MLVSEYANLDAAGNPVIEEGGTFALNDLAKTAEFLSAREDLFASEAEVAGATYANHLADVKTLLDEYDGLQRLMRRQLEWASVNPQFLTNRLSKSLLRGFE